MMKSVMHNTSPLDQEDGTMLIFRRAGLLLSTDMLEQAREEQRVAARALAREMGEFPLALGLAGDYIKQTGCSVQDYLQMYRGYATRTAKPAQPFDPHVEDLEIAIGLSLAWLERERPAAVKILQTCAFLAPDTIPIALFTQGKNELNEAQQEIVLNPSTLESALATLQTLGLITRQADMQAFDIHPLVQKMLREALSADEQRQCTELAIHALYRRLPFAGTFQQRLPVIAHIRQVIALSEPWKISSAEAAAILDWAASLMWEQQAYPEAEALLRKALAICERALGTSHPTIANMLHTLATLQERSGNYIEAEALLQRSVLIRVQTQGPYHSDIVLSLNNLGCIYMEQGKSKEARQCYQKALWIGEQVLGPEHPLIPSMQGDLGMLYLQEEQFAEAESYFTKALPSWEKTQGAEHVSTIEILQRLAEAYMGQEKWEQAEPVLQRIAPACERIRGAEHINTVKILHHLAVVYVMREKPDLAEPLLQRVLAAWENNLEPEHPDLVNVLHNLALIYIAQEKWEQAEPLLQRILPAYANSTGQTHPQTISCMEQLAFIYAQEGKMEQAEEMERQITEIREKQTQGTETSEILEGLGALAGQCMAQGKFTEAEVLLQHAVAISEHVPEAEPLSLAELLGVLAIVYAGQGKFDRGAASFQQALSILELELGPDHPDTQTVREYYQQLQTLVASS